MKVIGIIATLIGVAVGIVTLIKERKIIVNAIASIRGRIKDANLPNRHRRNIIIVLSVGMVGSLAHVALPRLKKLIIQVPVIKRPIDNDKFVKNEKSGVIHHVTACAGHLPQQQVNVEPSEIVAANMMHSSKLVYIAGLQGTEPESEGLLINAIKNSPTSVHLYKFLISSWGRKKQYTRIHEFIEINLEYLLAVKSANSHNERLSRKYSKAITELERRRNKARYLAKMAHYL